MIINYWHTLLDMPKKDIDWHIRDIQDEQLELKEATGFINSWSELSDISYTYSSALWSGHDIARPINYFLIFLGYFYMLPKYSSRWFLFYRAGKAVNPQVKIRAVRNPQKIHKLREVAEAYNLDPELFKMEVEKRLKYWPLLK